MCTFGNTLKSILKDLSICNFHQKHLDVGTNCWTYIYELLIVPHETAFDVWTSLHLCVGRGRHGLFHKCTEIIYSQSDGSLRFCQSKADSRVFQVITLCTSSQSATMNGVSLPLCKLIFPRMQKKSTPFKTARIEPLLKKLPLTPLTSGTTDLYPSFHSS